MTKWLSGPRGAVFTIVLWVVGWALGFGGLAEMFVDPDGETLDVWPAEMAIPGFFAGLMFAALLLLVEGRRRFDEVPLIRFTIWGGVTGLTLGVVSITTDGPIPLSLTSAEMLSLATALCVVAAIGTSVFFRLLVRRPVLTMARRAH
jgi:peptidoglycan/LPS O-acetylase OafA/YrhL